MTEHSKAERELILASFELGQAQRALEEAEQRFKEALDKVDSLEGLAFGSVRKR